MNAWIWHLEANTARLLSWTIDLSQPTQGLRDIDSPPESPVHLLGITLPSQSDDRTGYCYTRGPDLLAVYGESPPRPVPVDARWCAIPPAASDRTLGAIDLVVSVRSQQFESQPSLTVHSAIRAAEVLRLAEPAAPRFVPCPAPQHQPLVVRSSEGPGCFVFRRDEQDTSYAEMVHPVDFRESELIAPGDLGTQIGPVTEVRHRLFAGSLEKGVILRARVRGVFLPRDGDLQLAAQCYSAFAAADPPLST